MRRRKLLSSVVVGAAGISGCVGGNEVATSVQRTVSVTPGQGWIERIPETNGGAVQYKARADRPFEVFLFTSEEDFMFYDTFTDGGDPARTPTGHDRISTAAEQVSDTTYEAATPNGGARTTIGEPGPSFFVVDNSAYLDGPGPGEHDGEDLSVFVDLTVTENHFSL